MGYDGSINISTKIDTQGINKGTKSISSSLGGVLRSVMAVAKAMTAVFIGGSIINGIRSLIGQFDLMGSSIGASVKQLSTSFDALKGAFVNLLLTALAPLIPYVITFVQWLTQLFTIVTQIIGALFGVQAGFGGVASSAGGAGKAIKKAGKEAQGALAAFDQINVLSVPDKQQPDTGGGGSGSGGLGIPAVDPISPELLAKLEEFKAKAAEFFRPLTEALGRLYESLKPLGQTIWEGLKWAWDNILVPLGTWVVSDLLPAFLDMLSEAAETLNTALITLKPMALWLWEEFIKPAGEVLGEALINFLDWATEGLKNLNTWIKNNADAFQIIVLVVAAFVAWLVILLNPVAATIAAVAAMIAILKNWGAVWEWLRMVGSFVLSDIKNLWAGLASWFSTTVLLPLKNVFSVVLDAIQGKFSSIFTNIQNFVKGAVNTIIGYVNTMISNIVNGLNGVIGGLNRVGSVVPGFSSIAMVAAPQIPRLAKGAVIPPNAEFAAILGDQKSGKNIETPVSLMRSTFEEALQKAITNQTININFNGSMGELVRMLKPQLDRETNRAGLSLINGV